MNENRATPFSGGIFLFLFGPIIGPKKTFT